MNNFKRLVGLVAIIFIPGMLAASNMHGPHPLPSPQLHEKSKMKTITGEFEVKMKPLEATDSMMGSFELDKVYHGDLEAIGKGRMLTGMTSVKESAAYVAIEKVTGKIEGKEGSFLIHHRGVMQRGKKDLEIQIVPDSGTEGLTGIQGEMDIDIRDGKHFYTMRYGFEGKSSEE